MSRPAPNSQTLVRRLSRLRRRWLLTGAVAGVAGLTPAAPGMLHPDLGDVRAEPLPPVDVPGYRFPEREATLTAWVTDWARAQPETAAVAFEHLHRHAWGLWMAVTQVTGQRIAGQTLRVFETWTTPEELIEQAGMPPAGAGPSRPARRAPLRRLRQFAGPVGGRAVGLIKYDPAAAAHILRQDLLHRATLDTLREGGAQGIPPFPSDAIALKPVFQVLRMADLRDHRYALLPVWSGPPAQPQAWGPAQWPGAVWIDVTGGGQGTGAIDRLSDPDGAGRTAANTYPLADLIHYELSADDAAQFDRELPGAEASGGDVAVLVAMHVATREIARWTWQTFWWTPDPDRPPLPSSPAVAAVRPAALQGAPRHYALALAYNMLSPEPPYVGGVGSGLSVYTYNPWVEARFGPADLPDSRAGLGPGAEPEPNNVGTQTNCMSCHAQANYAPGLATAAPRFTGDRYVDIGGPEFFGTLQVDFLWSVALRAR